MVDYEKLHNELMPLIGFYREPGVDIQESMYNSVSGTYYQETHPLLTLRGIAEIAPVTNDRLYPTAKVGDSYKKGQVISFLDSLYEVKSDTIFTVPVTENSHIEKTTFLSQWIKTKIGTAIRNVVSNVIQKSIIAKQGKEILSNLSTLTKTGAKEYMCEENTSVIRLALKPNAGVAVRVSSIRTPSYPVYVFKKTNILHEQSLIAVIQTATDFPFIVLNRENLTTLFAEFYFVYSQPAGEKIKSSNLISETPYFTVNTYSLPTNSFDESLESVELNMAEAEHAFGLDLEATVVCDFTELFVKNKFDFINLVKLQFTVNTLKEFLYNPNVRINRTSMIASRAELLYALDGENSKFAKDTGLSKDLKDAYNAFILNTSGYNSECLPCIKKGVAYRTIG